MAANDPADPAPRPTARKSALGNGRLWLTLGIIAGVVTTAGVVAYRVFYSPFLMPSGSMIPTIEVGERFAVNRMNKTPVRGDVVVFQFPEHPEQEFVKRVIAVGGETLSAKGGHPVINGWEVPSCKVGAYKYTEPDAFGSEGRHSGDLYVEFLGDAAYLTFYDSQGNFTDELQGPWEAKPGEYWVFGDNRHNSHDSRVWYGGNGGGVPAKLMRGSVTRPTVPVLPAGAAALRPAFDACMSGRPPRDKANPPAR